MPRQKGIQFLIALIVFGKPHKTGVYPIPKIDTEDRSYIELLGLAHKIESGRGVVDIGQGQLGHMILLGQLQEFELGKGSEAHTVICVAV